MRRRHHAPYLVPTPDPITGMSKVDRDIADAKAVAERLGYPTMCSTCSRPSTATLSSAS